MSLQYNQTIKLSGELYCLASLFLWGDGTCEKPQVCKRVKILVHSCWLHQINTHTFEKVKHISTPETVPLILVHRSRENGSHIHVELDLVSKLLAGWYSSDLIILTPSFCVSESTQAHRGDTGFFFRRGCTRLLLYFNTNEPHSFFFAEYQLY